MKSTLTLVFLIIIGSCTSKNEKGSFTPLTHFELSDSLESADYYSVIDYYKNLADHFQEARLIEYGPVDVGKPLHLLVLSGSGNFDPEKIRSSGKNIIMIMNGIHPGESCGIDASMLFARDLLNSPDASEILSNTVIVLIPVYNIGGSLNRGRFTRANQLGPVEQGFRGNGQNLDLNRDFIKSDSKNMNSFARIFNLWSPDLFIDTHTSNGADYQYNLTMLSTQKDKLHPLLSAYMEEELNPALYRKMKAKGEEMIPYVHTMSGVPDNGIRAFLETPRYSSGFVTLFNTIGYITEAHMLKSYAKRVKATYTFLNTLTETISRDEGKMHRLRIEANDETANQERFPINWVQDTTRIREIEFKGFEYSYVKSKATGLNRLYYDREKPYSKTIPFYDSYIASEWINKPYAYVIPQAYEKVTGLMTVNGIKSSRISKDTILESEVYYIEHNKTMGNPWEGHFFHTEVELRKDTQAIQVFEGDFVVFPDQSSNRYIVETLEPRAVDAFFRWNFFDAILMQKEYFSGYVFDDTAAEMIETESELRAEFNEFKESSPEVYDNQRVLLDFIYRHSKYYEKSHKRYPVIRIMDKMTLPLK